MKYIKTFLLAIIAFWIFSQGDLNVSAQETPAVTNTIVAPQAQNPTETQTVTSSFQTVRTSNRVCVKVGEAKDEDKPTSCNQPAQTDTGFIGPIGGAAPTIEYCGEEPTGEVIMCYKPGYVFYCQGDSRWANSCDLIRAGCGPTTMAMIFSAYGDTILPPDMDKIFQQRKWRACGDNVSYMENAIQSLLPESGYEYHKLGIPLNLTRAQEYLNAGYLIIGSTFGHIFVIDGVNIAANTLSLRDPGLCENKDGVVRSASTPWAGQALMYAYAVKKKVAQ